MFSSIKRIFFVIIISFPNNFFIHCKINNRFFHTFENQCCLELKLLKLNKYSTDFVEIWFVNSHDAILGTEIIEFSKKMILLFINLSAATSLLLRLCTGRKNFFWFFSQMSSFSTTLFLQNELLNSHERFFFKKIRPYQVLTFIRTTL